MKRHLLIALFSVAASLVNYNSTSANNSASTHIHQSDCSAVDSSFLKGTTHQLLRFIHPIAFPFTSPKTTIESPTTMLHVFACRLSCPSSFPTTTIGLLFSLCSS